MTRTEKFLRNSASTALLQIVTMISGFIIPKIMLIIYGSEINGLVSSITQVIKYFMLVEAGLSAAVIYSLYKPLATKDYNKISAIVVAAKKFYNKSGYIFVGLTICLSISYPLVITTNELSLLEVSLLVLILGVSGALEFFTLAKYRAILTADQKVYVISIASIIYIIFNTIIISVLSYLKMNIVLVMLISLVAVFLRSYILYFFVKKNYSYLDYNTIPDNRSLDKRWDALYLQILGVFHTGIPIILATIFTDLKTVSVYVIYNLVISGVNAILNVFMSGISSSFGDLIVRKEKERFQKAYIDFEGLYYLLIAGAYAVTFVMIMPFINIYTQGITDTNYNLPWIGFLIVLNGLMFNIKTPQGMLVIAAGLYRETRWQTTTQALIMLILGIILGYIYGLEGILIASILSNLYRDIDLVYFIPKYVTKLPKKKTIFRIIGVFFINIMICLPMHFINIQSDTVIRWIVDMILVMSYSIFIIGIYIFIFEKNIIKDLLSRLQNLKKR
ncbi:MAG: hypothetical protein SO083_03285 [Megamonas funiformis]|uniref:lipopolysaccharide biosynthesis protein n=1 Tax=Megamonas funiformis TaxID=437897 RepID=UPI002A7F6CD7|nr:hypothetical protein [Megamonas funiformis]MDY3874177.1 hypothetical protein [Megamonas funiformis]